MHQSKHVKKLFAMASDKSEKKYRLKITFFTKFIGKSEYDNNNKTGLQPVSRLVAQIVGFF